MVTERVAVLGFGSSGERFASLVGQRLPEAEILVYSSRFLDGGAFRSTSNLEDVKKFDPSIAIICGVASKRVTMIEALPDALRGVFVEKPLAATFEEAEWATNELERRSPVVQVGYNLRYSPSIREFKRRIDSLSLGRVISVRAETGQHLPDWRGGRDYRTTASASEASGGGVLRELSHEIDYLRWIFGNIDWVSAWSGQQSGLELDVEDTAHLTVGFSPTGSPAEVVGQLNLDFVRHDSARTMIAICEDGSVRWDGVSLRVEEWRQGSSAWEIVYAEDGLVGSTYELQWDSFYSEVARGTTPEVTLEDGLAVLSVIDAARTSHDSGGIRVRPVRTFG